MCSIYFYIKSLILLLLFNNDVEYIVYLNVLVK